MKAGGLVNAHCFHFGTTVSHGMWTSGQTGPMKICHQTFFVRHALQWRRKVGFREFFQQRARAANGFFDLPERVAAVSRVPSTEYRVVSEFRVSGFEFRVASSESRIWRFFTTE